MRICVFGAASNKISPRYVSAVESLGCTLAKRGHSLVFGGGNNGAMGAAARGVARGGGKILGIAPKFLNADGVLYNNCTEIIYTETMRERKKLLEDNADAYIITPGGMGTFDELFEILTLKQLGRENKPIAIYNVDGYYNPLIALIENAVKENFMTEESTSLYSVFDNADELFEYLENYSYEIKDVSCYKSVPHINK